MIPEDIGTMLGYAAHQVDLAQAQILVDVLPEQRLRSPRGCSSSETTFARFFGAGLYRLRGIKAVRQGDLAGAKTVLRATRGHASWGARSYRTARHGYDGGGVRRTRRWFREATPSFHPLPGHETEQARQDPFADVILSSG